jgi:predicted dehydrogenase/threonine dehydrogenase-like Zn-dependent dehydrogenase
MEQVTQQLKTGEIIIQELPMPMLATGMLLVRNHYSVISAGTEGSTVKTARKSLVGKAKERPQQVKQVIDVLRQQGPVQTYRTVMKKLDAYSPLGYSCAGEVIEVGTGVKGYAIGDNVACAGNHAEVVCAPVNLCVKLPPDANLKRACYNTLGAIALQGIRQAELRLGESCVVIGLGLLGQLTCLMLQAGGVAAYGIDIDTHVVEIAKKHCADHAWTRSDTGVAEQIEKLTGGIGVDAVIITAATRSLDPINFAGQIARKKGRVVVVGAAPTGFDREPYYYKKELEVRMSCSYGPGRYDINYEEKGIDYPAAYVRWTEKRNMQAFQELLHSERINIDYLTTHEFLLDDAPKAYDMIVNRSEPYLGIVLEYDINKPMKQARVEVSDYKPEGKVRLAFIGAGSYAQGSLLPNVPHKDSDVVCKAVMTNSGTTSKRVAERFGFEYCTSDIKDILDNEDINTVFITTRHDSHAEYVLKSLRAMKNVFVEKPLCLKVDELTEIEQVYGEERTGEAGQLMVGFNRRFAPHAVALKQRLVEAPMSMIYRINAGSIPADAWIQDTTVGGGRIIGEVCHFVDFLTFMCGSLPVRVYASALPDPGHLNDTLTVNLEFENESVGTICYFANGSKRIPKEYIEIYQSGLTGIIRDFKQLDIFGGSKQERKKLLNQNKGQADMVKALINRIKDGGGSLIRSDEIFTVTRATFGIIESLHSRQAVSIQI